MKEPGMTAPKHGTHPLRVEETPGIKAYCACGHSARLPYCDGSHSRLNTGCQPIVLEVTEAGRKSICQCHQTATKPWCDGAHKRLGGAGTAP
jgi:CDGSH iron-sulfur domain-containing protein 3